MTDEAGASPTRLLARRNVAPFVSHTVERRVWEAHGGTLGSKAFRAQL